MKSVGELHQQTEETVGMTSSRSAKSSFRKFHGKLAAGLAARPEPEPERAGLVAVVGVPSSNPNLCVDGEGKRVGLGSENVHTLTCNIGDGPPLTEAWRDRRRSTTLKAMATWT